MWKEFLCKNSVLKRRFYTLWKLRGFLHLWLWMKKRLILQHFFGFST